MAVFKCKMCGGTIEFEEGATVGVCDSCGTKQTLPKLDDDKKANLYDRANHFRRNNEFDKAIGIYEKILEEDKTDAEAYWSLVLCTYGIEYVEDPTSKKRVPTVNRAQYTSIFADENYKAALEFADTFQKEIYEAEAKTIDEIQKGILAISSKEEPFDVFICYKETDENGRRTPDSVLATELYNELTREGYKVFFSRITLEDKLGQEYEPYIFAALNSSKVMVVLGTKPEHFNAVWVKNEWSRYLSLIKKGERKMLIPAYKDMDPYDLPEEFSHLQAQDMSKLGFMPDLVRGISKIVDAETKEKTTTVKETVVANVASTNSNVEPLLKRVSIFLEDRDWNSANEYCEKVLDQDPENAQAYLYKLLANFRVSKIEDLKNLSRPFDDNKNYKKVIRFADEKLKEQLKSYIVFINERIKTHHDEQIYIAACQKMEKADAAYTYKEAADLFSQILKYKDAKEKQKECFEKAEIAKKEFKYNSAINLMSDNLEDSYNKAIKHFESIIDYKDSREQIKICQDAVEKIKEQEELDRIETARKAEEERVAREQREEEQRIARKIADKKRKKIIAIVIPIICVCVAFIIILNTVIIPKQKYNKAMSYIESGNYESAYALLKDLDYKDSKEQKTECEILLIKDSNVGDEITFGSYEQDNDTSNGNEDIEWIVLAKEDNRILVISKYALVCGPYYPENTSTTWETSTLRTWLNGIFIEESFSQKEQKLIPTVTVTADDNPRYSIDPGIATEDKVFFLSIEETEQYFDSDDDRMCAPTDFAIAQGSKYGFGFTTDGNDKVTCCWWLRSPGSFQYCAACVGCNGAIDIMGEDVEDYWFVRPAMWIDLSAIE